VGFIAPILCVVVAIIAIAWTVYALWNRPDRP
jgi:hypothetical protein